MGQSVENHISFERPFCETEADSGGTKGVVGDGEGLGVRDSLWARADS